MKIIIYNTKYKKVILFPTKIQQKYPQKHNTTHNNITQMILLQRLKLQIALIAQLVVHLFCKQKVACSIHADGNFHFLLKWPHFLIIY